MIQMSHHYKANVRVSVKQGQPISVTNIQQQILSHDLLKQVTFMSKQLSVFRVNANTDKRQLNDLLPATSCLVSTASASATTFVGGVAQLVVASSLMLKGIGFDPG